jgi:RNA polymerase sigma-70 factor, ECF subfamily
VKLVKAEELRKVFETHEHTLFLVARRILRNQSEAKDVLGAVFVRFYTAVIRGTDDIEDPRSWLIRVTVNACNDILRHQKVRAEAVHDVTGIAERLGLARDTPDPEQLADDANLRRVLDEALAELTPLMRESFLLYYRDELTHAEIAAQLQITEATSRTRVSSARQRLRERRTAFREWIDGGRSSHRQPKQNHEQDQQTAEMDDEVESVPRRSDAPADEAASIVACAAEVPASSGKNTK